MLTVVNQPSVPTPRLLSILPLLALCQISERDIPDDQATLPRLPWRARIVLIDTGGQMAGIPHQIVRSNHDIQQ